MGNKIRITEKDKPCKHVPVTKETEYRTWKMVEEICVLCGTVLKQEFFHYDDVRNPNREDRDYD